MDFKPVDTYSGLDFEDQEDYEAGGLSTHCQSNHQIIDDHDSIPVKPGSKIDPNDFCDIQPPFKL